MMSVKYYTYSEAEHFTLILTKNKQATLPKEITLLKNGCRPLAADACILVTIR